MDDKLLIWALENAVTHKAQARAQAIIGHLLNEDAENRKRMKELMPKINETIAKVNAMAYDAQVDLLRQLNPAFFAPKEERNIFAFLNIEPGQQVISAFPPGPEKYPHIGHAKALLLNHELARAYDGKFILRFEDTNPRLVKEEFYTIMLENFSWLGAKFDDIIYASDYMELYEQFATQLIAAGQAYVDRSSFDDIRLSREKGIGSADRDLPADEQMKLWSVFKQSEEGEMVVRLKIDLKHKNSTMRDPTIYRIIKAPHARHGTTYSAWPGYDFQNAIMDGHLGITHRLRSIEFEMRSELHSYIRKLCNLPDTVTYEFGRFNMVGVESSGRIIREKIENGELLGWDDPSLTTLVALQRRGFQPEAIKEFVLKTGITKNTATVTWDDLYRINTRIMDNKAPRYFFVRDPVLITHGGEKRTIALRKHPKENMGDRTLIDSGSVYITQQDLENVAVDEPVRLLGNCTVAQVEGTTFSFVGADIATFKGKGKKIIHFVPEGATVPVQVIMPDKNTVVGVGESTLKELQVGDCVQFERFGNVRFDQIADDGTYVFWFTN